MHFFNYENFDNISWISFHRLRGNMICNLKTGVSKKVDLYRY